MLYFTSDLHLGHENIIKLTGRPFRDAAEMNRVLIGNINETVGENDELWILGDVSFRISRAETLSLLSLINCRNIHLISGNHDSDYSETGFFKSVQIYKELDTEYGKFILFHYPIHEWNRVYDGAVHLHGHIHSGPEYNRNNLKLKFSDRFSFARGPECEKFGVRIFDVGVDANNFRPVSIEQIASFMNLTVRNRKT